MKTSTGGKSLRMDRTPFVASFGLLAFRMLSFREFGAREESGAYGCIH
jgi:hypothetical protein